MKLIYGLLSLLLPCAANAALPVPDTTEFTLTTQQDTIRFIRIAQDTTLRKPVLLFLQGSLPYPLIITEKSRASVFYLDQCDFDHATISQDYDIVLISKPHTPVVADVAHLNDCWQYVPDTAQPDRFDTHYLADDRPERYAERAAAVLRFIRSQPWADTKKIILMGHSQGAHIAARVAAENPDIFAVGYFSGNPMGRFAELIVREQQAARSGRITPAQAQENIERLYTQWQLICRGKSNTKGGDPPGTWMGFSEQYIGLLTTLPMPLYVAYGTEDPAAQCCALLPVYFELAAKRNYCIRAFQGCGHNFEAVRPDGSGDYDKTAWKQAIGEFLAWCKNPVN